VVEDDDSFAEALTQLLEADGRLGVAGRARDGREAIELAEALRPDARPRARSGGSSQPSPSSRSPARSTKSVRSRCKTQAQSISSDVDEDYVLGAERELDSLLELERSSFREASLVR
jgi:DNA-binding NarL/FixJ family response regulator